MQRRFIKKSSKNILVGLFSIVSIVLIIVTAYFVVNKKLDIKSTTNDNLALEEKEKKTLDEIDLSQLYKTIVLDKETNAVINNELIEYELLKAISAKYFDKIKNGSIRIKRINEKTLLFFITINWIDGSISHLNKEIKIINLS